MITMTADTAYDKGWDGEKEREQTTPPLHRHRHRHRELEVVEDLQTMKKKKRRIPTIRGWTSLAIRWSDCLRRRRKAGSGQTTNRVHCPPPPRQQQQQQQDTEGAAGKQKKNEQLIQLYHEYDIYWMMMRNARMGSFKGYKIMELDVTAKRSSSSSSSTRSRAVC